jgi:hypothetical protein
VLCVNSVQSEFRVLLVTVENHQVLDDDMNLQIPGAVLTLHSLHELFLFRYEVGQGSKSPRECLLACGAGGSWPLCWLNFYYSALLWLFLNEGGSGSAAGQMRITESSETTAS